MSRPSKVQPDRLQAIIDDVRDGAPVVVAARGNGLEESTFYRWMREGAKLDGRPLLRTFYQAITRARVECERRMAEKWVKVVTEGTTKTTITETHDMDGDLLSTKTVTEVVGDADWRGIAEFLLRRYPERWSRKEGVEHTGPDGAPLETAPIPLEKLSMELKRRIVTELETGGDTVELDPGEYKMLTDGESESVSMSDSDSECVSESVSDSVESKVAPLPIPDWCGS